MKRSFLWLIWAVIHYQVASFNFGQEKYEKGRVHADRPNILFIVVDDLAPVITSYGGQAWTPNIDQLAAQSLRFTNAYAQQALCAPSRVSFLTGRRPDTTKTYFNFATYWRKSAGNFTTLPQYFKEAGYFTASFGKIFHNGPVCGKFNDFQFSWSVRPYKAPTKKFDYTPTCLGLDGKLHFNLLCPVNVSSQPGGSLPDIQTTDHILEIFQKLSRARDSTTDSSQPHLPFFLGMGFHKPHISFRYPEQFLDLYPLESVHIAPNAFFAKKQPPVAWDPFMDVRRRDDFKDLKLSFPYGPIPLKYHYLIRQAYYASTTYMDYELGRVLAGLEAAGFADNTIISFISDHGWQLGEHQEWSKYSNFATSSHIPFMIHVPSKKDFRRGDDKKLKFPLRDPFLDSKSSLNKQLRKDTPGGLVSDAMVELIDVFPTLVDLASLPVPPICPVNSSSVVTCVEGISLAPLLKNRSKAFEKKWKKAAFTQYPRPSDQPRPDSDQPALANITIMGYSMITADKYHYTEWVGFNNNTCTGNWSDVHARELYILDSDPLEDNNVADESLYESLIRRLSNELHLGWRNALPEIG